MDTAGGEECLYVSERTAGMIDMPPEGFHHILFVEAATIEPPVLLAPGAAWSGGQSITVEA